MYKHVLVAVAFDAEHDPERSLQAAAVLAPAGARVTLLHVKEAIPSYAISYIPEDYDQPLNQAIRDQLSEMAARFTHAQPVLLEGHSGRTILEWAEENEVDCIVIASHRSGLQDYLLGSTAGRIVGHARCSVHVVR